MEEKKRIFTSCSEKWTKRVNQERVFSATLSTQTVERGILLPLRKRTDITTVDGCHEGGVCTEEYEYVAGVKRDRFNNRVNYSCWRAYTPQEKPVWRDETVVFGGVLYAHFGHMIADAMPRMWWFAENPDTPYKIVFLMMTNQTFKFPQFFDLAGLSPDRYEIITEPTQFAQIIVPDEAIYSTDAACRQWLSFFELIKQKVSRQLPPSPYKKIYLTRTQLPEKDGINEEFYEEFYKQQGYTVIAPEKLSLAEQINLIAGAEKVVTTLGTLSHLAVFAQDKSEWVILLREPETIVLQQIIINELKQLDWCYVEVTKNILPTTHAHGMFLYCYTEYFQDYLNSWGITPVSAAQEQGQISPELLQEYCAAWVEHYKKPVHFKWVKNKQMRDLLKSLSCELLGQDIDISQYPSPLKDEEKKWKRKLDQKEEELEKLRKICKDRENELKKIKNSRSWKMTAFLRKGNTALKKCLAKTD